MRFLVVLGVLASLASPPVVDRVDTAPSARSDLVEALEVLHSWDDRRADAWAGADAEALRSLYVRGSAAGRADARLLRAYADRGLVVRRLVTQVFAVRILDRDATRLKLSVFDRVAGGEVLQDGRVVALRSSPPVTRTVVFRLVSGRWLVASVREAPGSPH